jgi:hypothetical protein
LNLEEKAVQYLEALEKLTIQYAPDVVNASLLVVQLNAIGQILVAFVLLLGTILFWWKLAPTLWKWAEGFDKDMPGIFGLLGGGFGSIVTIPLSFIILFDIWTWVAIFEPKLYIAYKILNKVL